MRQLFTILACSMILLSATGCHFSAGIGSTPKPADKPKPIEPSIEGAWSEPVNGIRMKMMHVLSPGGTTPQLTLLIFAQNVSDKEVDLPRLKPYPFVKVSNRRQEYDGYSNVNLMITAQPIDGQQPSMRLTELLKEQMQEIDARRPLKPGEMRVFAFQIVAEELVEYLQQWSDDTLYAERITWSGLDDEQSAGRWRLHAVYRPSGFNPPDTQLKRLMDQQWVNRQIDLPVTVLKLDPWHYYEGGQSFQQLEERR